MLQGMSHAEITDLIVNILKVRKISLQKFHGHKVVPFSRYAKHVLEKKRLI